MKRILKHSICITLSYLALVFVTLGTNFGLANPLPDAFSVKNPSPIAQNFTLSDFERISALSDPEGRISKEFQIPEGLKLRTAFWFDVYTKYGGMEHVIHHTLYPWIVYDVVDTRSIYELNLHKWTKYHKSKKQVQTQLASIRKALSRLAKYGINSKSSALEVQLAEVLKSVPGNRRKVYRQAAHNVRVQLGQKDFIRSGLAYSEKYLPHMESTFQNMGLPVELTRIPFVESSFNVLAESKVGASGIWQIMPVTGRQYLTVDAHLDERNSPLKATLAAVEILKSNYRSLKSWPLAVTAYNHGPTGIRKALKAARAEDLVALINKYYGGNFQFASANFYTSFLAVLHAEMYHREIFKNELLEPQKPLEHSVVSLDKKMRFNELLKKLTLSRDVVLAYNLDLKSAAKSNSLIPRGYKILVPANHSTVISPGRSNSFREAALTLNKKSRTSGS